MLRSKQTTEVAFLCLNEAHNTTLKNYFLTNCFEILIQYISIFLFLIFSLHGKLVEVSSIIHFKMTAMVCTLIWSLAVR